MAKKLISIIIPVYNEEKYIGRCLDSLRKQSYDMSMCEVLIVDGGSTDKTLEIVEAYDLLNIRIIHNPKRIVTYAVNLGIDSSAGEIIIRLDAHSEFDVDYIKKCIYHLKQSGADNVGGVAETKGIGIIGEANADILSSKFGVGNSQFRTGSKGGYVDTVPFGCFKRELINRIGKFNVDLPRSEDNDFNSRIRAAGGKVFLSPDIKFIYYCRDTGIGLLSQGIKNGNALFFTLKKNPKAMSIRHFVPFLFLMSIIIGTVVSFFNKYLFIAFAAELALYLVLDVFFSLKGHKKMFFYKLVMFPAFHILYGLGSLLCLFGVKLY